MAKRDESTRFGPDAGLAAALAVFVLAVLGGCSVPPPELGPTRGYVLISLDTLGAAHLGAYGSTRDTSPFFDRLAERGTLFENAFVQYPSTLVSHTSIFTGLYPREHGVRLPGERLAPSVEMLPERFRDHGFATGGFTEGGFVSASYGFDRGFDEFYERLEFSTDDEVGRTFGRGLEFVRGLAAGEPFFLFLHTYSIHDPYEPPEPYRSMFLTAEPTPDLDSSGRFFREIYMGRDTVGEETVEELRALYDGSVRYVDSVLEGFFEDLEASGLLDEVTVVITSDHGEEFAQHGSLGHFQVYPETLRVPLLIVHPGQTRGARVSTPVESIDIGPTLFELAGISPAADVSGRSLVPALGGSGGLEDREVFAEVFDQRSQLALIQRRAGRILQHFTSKLVAEADGTWVTRATAFDLPAGSADLELVSFAERRAIAVSVDGEPREPLLLGGEWTSLDLEPAASSRRIVLATGSCSVPLYLGVGEDSRCLSFKVRGAELRRDELYDLTVDPVALQDLAAEQPELRRDLARLLAARRWDLRASPVSGAPSSEAAEVLRALGYID